MGFDEGQITLSSENGAYFPGQPILGKLVFNQEKVKKFRGIYAKLKGYCRVHWTTTSTRTNSQGKQETYTVNHESDEEYVNSKVYLIGGERGEVELNAGKYEFPFEFFLPGHCPSSFEGTVGHIRYEIKVVVDRAFKIDQEKKVAIRVISPVDLNQITFCREPIQFEFEDTYCCCCMGRGAMDAVVKLPVSGYCPGQVIPIEVACQNSGVVEINEIKLIIKKIITYHASVNPATKETKDIIAEIKKGPVPGDTTRTWNVEMMVPIIDTYNLNSCKYIDLDYNFKVVVSPSGCHTASEDRKKLIIGSIPLLGFQDNLQNPLQDQMPNIIGPIVNQPVSNNPGNFSRFSGHPAPSPYPSQSNKASYPEVTPFPPPSNANTPYPNPQNTPYPMSPQTVGNPAYPAPQNTPYLMSPQAAVNPAYTAPQNTPYPMSPQTGVNSPYPAPQNTPYPMSPQVLVNSPYSTNQNAYTHSPQNVTSPYPTAAPYPVSLNQPTQQSAYQTNSSYPESASQSPQNMPYPPQGGQIPSYQSSGLKTGTIGFTVSSPNPMPTASPVNPFATASAPADTPDKEKL